MSHTSNTTLNLKVNANWLIFTHSYLTKPDLYWQPHDGWVRGQAGLGVSTKNTQCRDAAQNIVILLHEYKCCHSTIYIYIFLNAVKM